MDRWESQELEAADAGWRAWGGSWWRKGEADQQLQRHQLVLPLPRRFLQQMKRRVKCELLVERKQGQSSTRCTLYAPQNFNAPSSRTVDLINALTQEKWKIINAPVLQKQETLSTLSDGYLLSHWQQPLDLGVGSLHDVAGLDERRL